MGIEKGICAAVITVFAGFVGYKILQKKNPELVKSIKDSFSNAGNKFSAVVAESKQSFQEGYANG